MLKNSTLKNAAQSSVVLMMGCVLGCSDPIPPSPEAAFSRVLSENTATPEICDSRLGVLSVGEDSNAFLDGLDYGEGRVKDGRSGADVSCTVAKNATGFSIAATIKADTIQTVTANGGSYSQDMSLTAEYAGFTPNLPATARMNGQDTYTQKGGSDSTCTLSVKSFGADGDGGALWAEFDCPDFADDNSGTSCRMRGVIVLENCDK